MSESSEGVGIGRGGIGAVPVVVVAILEGENTVVDKGFVRGLILLVHRDSLAEKGAIYARHVRIQNTCGFAL